ncbi:flagellar hook-length control protein FliK [Vibrio sp.]|nr:flagellar hook-length control protein FliK [Vibrio sp.]
MQLTPLTSTSDQSSKVITDKNSIDKAEASILDDPSVAQMSESSGTEEEQSAFSKALSSLLESDEVVKAKSSEDNQTGSSNDSALLIEEPALTHELNNEEETSHDSQLKEAAIAAKGSPVSNDDSVGSDNEMTDSSNGSDSKSMMNGAAKNEGEEEVKNASIKQALEQNNDFLKRLSDSQQVLNTEGIKEVSLNDTPSLASDDLRVDSQHPLNNASMLKGMVNEGEGGHKAAPILAALTSSHAVPPDGQLKEWVTNKAAAMTPDDMMKLSQSMGQTSELGRIPLPQLQIGQQPALTSLDKSNMEQVNIEKQMNDSLIQKSLLQSHNASGGVTGSTSLGGIIAPFQGAAPLVATPLLTTSSGEPPLPLMQNKEQASEQLADRMNMMLSKNLKHVDIRLDPPDLGRMQIRMNLNGDNTSVQFTVANPQVRDMIEQTMPRLREMMAQHGIQLSESSVQQQSSQQQSSQQQSAQQQSAQQQSNQQHHLNNAANAKQNEGDEANSKHQEGSSDSEQGMNADEIMTVSANIPNNSVGINYYA